MTSEKSNALIRFDKSKFDKPSTTLNCFSQATSLASAIKHNYNYLSSSIASELLDATLKTLDMIGDLLTAFKQ